MKGSEEGREKVGKGGNGGRGEMGMRREGGGGRRKDEEGGGDVEPGGNGGGGEGGRGEGGWRVILVKVHISWKILNMNMNRVTLRPTRSSSHDNIPWRTNHLLCSPGPALLVLALLTSAHNGSHSMGAEIDLDVRRR